MMIAAAVLLALLTLTPLIKSLYVDTVIPSGLIESDETPQTRAARLDANVRLLTALTLQQQGWQLYEQNWYRLFEVEMMWIPAENFCRQMGGHLPSIRNKAENDFLHNLRKKNNIWIGLNKLSDTFGPYGWSDNTKADYLNWDSTQPNEPDVHCVYMAYNLDKQGTWFDYGCHEKLPQYFVCKIKLN